MWLLRPFVALLLYTVINITVGVPFGDVCIKQGSAKFRMNVLFYTKPLLISYE